ncbi:MAG TPA: hypothetical protein PLQ93_02010 [Bacteroidia bacterium]|nr:hypothetical protein [Bacteroidia bacterium]
MKKFILITTLLGAGLIGRAQDQGPKPTGDPTVYKGVTDQACAVEVNFGSYAAGIDGPAFDKVMALIKKQNLAYTSKNIGREGETRICLPLTELKGSKKSKFIKQLKKIAREGQLVSVSIR